MWLVASVVGSSALVLTTMKYRGGTLVHSAKHRLWETLSKAPGAFDKYDARRERQGREWDCKLRDLTDKMTIFCC